MAGRCSAAARGVFLFVAAGILVLSCHAAVAQSSSDIFSVPGADSAARHNPFARQYSDLTRGYGQQLMLQSQRGVATDIADASDHWRHGSRRIVVGRPVYVLAYPPVYYNYEPLVNYYSPQFYYSAPAADVLPPLDNRIGVLPWQPQQQAQGQAAAPPGQVGQQPNAAPPAAAPPADSKARARAWKLIDSGDAQFREKHFSQALSRYRDAQSAARDLADTYFREGYALVAMARYSDAYRAMRRGLALDADWDESGFKLDDLYGDKKLTKSAHLDALQLAVEAHPHDADTLFLLAVSLYFDGQLDRSAPLFSRAAQVLGPADSEPLAGFLKHLPPPAKPAINPPAANPPVVNPPAANPPAKPIPAPPAPAPDAEPLPGVDT